MSRYDWEAGTVKIPSRAWASLKKTLRESHNAEREQVLKLAENVQKRLTSHFKGKRNVADHMVSAVIRNALSECSDDRFMVAEALVKASLKEGSAHQTRKITQAMLDQHAGPKATNKTLNYEGCEWGISLNDKDRSVRWEVFENNHAVERARESIMGRVHFRELGKIDYGRQKALGGVIVGNDEYNEDSECVGGGGNYTTATFGRAGELTTRWRLTG